MGLYDTYNLTPDEQAMVGIFGDDGDIGGAGYGAYDDNADADLPAQEVDEGVERDESTQAQAQAQGQSTPSHSLPPSPAPRLRVPQTDRVGLYQKLRPYPGMTKTEKFQRMLADSFAVASEPGTGSRGRDAMRGAAAGMKSYLGTRDYDRAIQSNYAQGVLGQVANQEKFGLESDKAGAEIDYKGAMGRRADAYGSYLKDTGTSRITRAGADVTKANAAAMNSRTLAGRPFFGPQGQTATPDGKGGYTIAQPPAKVDPKIAQTDEVIKRLKALNPTTWTPEIEAEVVRRMNLPNLPTPAQPTMFSMIYDAVTDPDPKSRAIKMGKIDVAVGLKRKFDPVKAPKSTPAAKRVDMIDDIIEQNKAKYMNAAGQVNWARLKADAQRGKLARYKDRSQDGPRDLHIAQRVEALARGTEERPNATTWMERPGRDRMGIELDGFDPTKIP